MLRWPIDTPLALSTTFFACSCPLFHSLLIVFFVRQIQHQFDKLLDTHLTSVLPISSNTFVDVPVSLARWLVRFEFISAADFVLRFFLFFVKCKTKCFIPHQTNVLPNAQKTYLQKWKKLIEAKIKRTEMLAWHEKKPNNNVNRIQSTNMKWCALEPNNSCFCDWILELQSDYMKHYTTVEMKTKRTF